ASTVSVEPGWIPFSIPAFIKVLVNDELTLTQICAALRCVDESEPESLELLCRMYKNFQGDVLTGLPAQSMGISGVCEVNALSRRAETPMAMRCSLLGLNNESLDPLNSRGARHPAQFDTSHTLVDNNPGNESCTETTKNAHETRISHDGSALDALLEAAQKSDFYGSYGSAAPLYGNNSNDQHAKLGGNSDDFRLSADLSGDGWEEV
ncbi:hypothetical protein MMC18_009564, partial [Xylographa bjoerkii]|nr:hypothetical protein [Xylographa bjoerkii]